MTADYCTQNLSTATDLDRQGAAHNYFLDGTCYTMTEGNLCDLWKAATTTVAAEGTHATTGYANC